MYRLTPRMVQYFKIYLNKYHDLLTGGRCSGWQLEELLTRAIRSDNSVAHHVKWKEGGHDDKADIIVTDNLGHSYPLEIKSGKIRPNLGKLEISGHRLGRFKGDMYEISDYLNSKSSDIIAVPCRRIDDKHGRRYEYTIHYVDLKYIRSISPSEWRQPTKSKYTQVNQYGVEFSLHPTMSWQIWWRIPLKLIESESEIIVP